jgi:hypothetical protein
MRSLAFTATDPLFTGTKGALRFRTSARPDRSGTVFALFLPFAAVNR